jgi:predicted O-methyltransferase YrrM
MRPFHRILVEAKHHLEMTMNTLNSPPLSKLLNDLFDESARKTPDRSPALAQLSDADRDRLMASRTEYREFYGLLKDLPLPVSRNTGLLLYMLARGMGARHIVEFGTSFGISALHFAAALRDNGGGRLITTEFEPSKVARAQAHFGASGLRDLIELREGDALQTLAADLPERIDVLLLDGAKALYPAVLKLVEDRLKPGAFIVADNVDDAPDYLSHVRTRPGYLSIPIADDVELTMCVG